MALAALGALATALVPLSQVPGRAEARGYPTPPAASAAFTLRGSNGFTIDVGSERGLITIAASERRPPIATFSPGGRPRPAGDVNGASSVYYARAAAAGPGAVEAPLGGLGRISVAFRPSGDTRVSVLRSGACPRPTRIVRRLGTFTGSIEFRGEEGYTAVRARRARGSVGTPLPASCRGEGAARAGLASFAGRRPASAGIAVLRAVDRRAGTSFRASVSGAGASFVATLEERLDGGLVVSRRAFAAAPASAFSFDRLLTRASVKPPAPFSGSARYEAVPGRGAPSWEGSLRATFPGASVPVTGPGFQSSLGMGR
jgi:hypothetical protein